MAGILVGVLLYRGLLRIPLRHFFSVTSWLILLLTAGLAAQAAGFLNQAGLLPALGNGVWDTSHLLSQDGYCVVASLAVANGPFTARFRYVGITSQSDSYRVCMVVALGSLW